MKFLLALLVAFIMVAEPVGSEENVIVSKNLFSPSRTPPANPKDGENPSLSPGEIQLDGIFFFNNQKMALLKISNKDSYIVAKEGDRIGSYQLLSIEKNHIVIDQKGTQHIVKLISPSKPTPPISIPLPVVRQEAPQPAKPQERQKSEAQQQEGSVKDRIEFPLTLTPEEFEKLPPEQREELVKKINEAMAVKASKIIKKKEGNQR